MYQETQCIISCSTETEVKKSYLALNISATQTHFSLDLMDYCSWSILFDTSVVYKDLLTAFCRLYKNNYFLLNLKLLLFFTNYRELFFFLKSMELLCLMKYQTKCCRCFKFPLELLLCGTNIR